MSKEIRDKMKKRLEKVFNERAHQYDLEGRKQNQSSETRTRNAQAMSIAAMAYAILDIADEAPEIAEKIEEHLKTKIKSPVKLPSR